MFKFNFADSASEEAVEHDIVMVNINGEWAEVTEDDPEVREAQ